MVETLVSIRAKYLLSTMQFLMVVPERPNVRKQSAKFVTFEDITMAQAQVLHDVVTFMCRNEFKETHDYIVELESRFMMQHPEADVLTWSAMWSNVLQKILASHSKHCKNQKGGSENSSSAGSAGSETCDFKKLLPPPNTIVPKTRFRDGAADPAAAGGVKDEPESSVPGQAQAAADPDPDPEPKILYFTEIYTAGSGNKKDAVHTLDVLAVQAQIQHTLLMRAGSLV